MLEVYQKCTFIEIDTNLRKFSRTWFSKKMRIIGKMKRSFSFILLFTGSGTSKISGTKFQINRLHTTFIANGDLNCYQNIMHTHLAIISTKRIKATKNRTCQNKGKYVL